MDAVWKLELSLGQRVVLICHFLLFGIILASLIPKSWSPLSPRWLRLTSNTRPYWYTIYILQALFSIYILHTYVLTNMITKIIKETTVILGDEDRILNAVWFGLLGLEVLMVLGVAVRSIWKRLSPQPKTRRASITITLTT